MLKFDSQEEEWFWWMIEELKEYGFILSEKYQPKPFLLSEAVKVPIIKSVKGKKVKTEKHLFHKHIYTADWIIVWNDKAIGLFTSLIGEEYFNTHFLSQRTKKGLIRSVIDVKGSFSGRNNTTAITFPLNQKAVWDKYEVYVQKIIPQKLFEATFTPKKYLYTKTGKKKKINWKVTLIEDFIKTI